MPASCDKGAHPTKLFSYAKKLITNEISTEKDIISGAHQKQKIRILIYLIKINCL